MRWIIRGLVALVILGAAYTAWPLFGLYKLVDAIETRDVSAIDKRINFPALRQSLTAQILTTYLRLTGREARLGPFRDLAVSATSSIADPIVARLISAQALAELLEKGWPTGGLTGRPISGGISRDALGTIWQLYVNSERGIREFKVAVPSDATPDSRFKLRLRLTGWVWKVSGLDLPEELRIRFAHELIKLVDKK